MKPAREFETVVGGRAVRYTVTRSRTAKRARIRVGPGGVVVVLTAGQPEAFAGEFLQANGGWVCDRLDAAPADFDRRPAVCGPAVWYRGEHLPVCVVRTLSRPGVALADGLIQVKVARTTDGTAALEGWLKREARRLLLPRVAELGAAVGHTPGRVFVRGQRTKWGNCSRLGNVSLNWRLVMAPSAVADAIITHELVHLIEPTHRPKFWLLLRTYCPGYAERSRWLDAHQAELFRPLAGRQAL